MTNNTVEFVALLGKALWSTLEFGITIYMIVLVFRIPKLKKRIEDLEDEIRILKSQIIDLKNKKP